MKHGPAMRQTEHVWQVIDDIPQTKFTVSKHRVVLDITMSGTPNNSMQEPGTSVRWYATIVGLYPTTSTLLFTCLNTTSTN
jgi:hypothetical protein